MRYLLLTLFFLAPSFAYNPYKDYLFCRYFQQENPKKAESYCMRALERSPTPTLFVDTVRIELQLKKKEKALEIAKRMKSLYPKDYESYLTLHSVYSMIGQYDKALSVLEEGYRILPKSKEIMLFLADEYLRKGENSKAKTVIENLAKESPDNPLPYYMLARIYLSEGNKELAIRYLEKSLQIKGSFEAGFITLGSIYEESGEYTRAEQLYKDVLKASPDNKIAL